MLRFHGVARIFPPLNIKAKSIRRASRNSTAYLPQKRFRREAILDIQKKSSSKPIKTEYLPFCLRKDLHALYGSVFYI